ncbi:MAG: hypothetical protein GKR94_02235 [Gammaproteobacteria bacterium]|nr:hypothetical protein [Gammaproteobacteria bacterium]
MQLRTYVSVLIIAAAGLNVQAAGDTSKSEKSRVGTCEDAKSQMAYFCDPKNAKKDSMVQIGTACNNAKNNVKEACEGIVEPDRKYTFDKD